MKKYILILSIFAFACSEEETTYSVDPALQTYIDTFVAESAERGVTIPKENLIVQFGPSQSVASVAFRGEQRYLYVSQAITDPAREYSIFNALGEIYVQNKVVVNAATYNRESFFDELIK
jgi:hypothetical protein